MLKLMACLFWGLFATLSGAMVWVVASLLPTPAPMMGVMILVCLTMMAGTATSLAAQFYLDWRA